MTTIIVTDQIVNPLRCSSLAEMGVSSSRSEEKQVRVAIVQPRSGTVDTEALRRLVEEESGRDVVWVRDAGAGTHVVVYVLIIGNRFDPVQRLIDLHENGASLSCPVPEKDSEEASLPPGAVGYDAEIQLSQRVHVLAVAGNKQGPWATSLGGLPVHHMTLDPVKGAVLASNIRDASWLVNAVRNE